MTRRGSVHVDNAPSITATRGLHTPLNKRVIIIRGAGEMATGVACRLHGANFTNILMLETDAPLAVRRTASFCEAIYEKKMTVEGIEALRIDEDADIQAAWASGKIAVLTDPLGESITRFKPDVCIDAVMAKRNLGTAITDAPLVVALGPGFTAGRDCHVVIETNRGHDLGRLIREGPAAANTGIPGSIGGYSRERVLRAPSDGTFTSHRQIGDPIRRDDTAGRVGGDEIIARIDGILRGLIRPGSRVTRGQKIGDIDPRGEADYCSTISEKARALGGAVLEAVLAVYNR